MQRLYAGAMTHPVSSDRRPLPAGLPARPGLRRLLALPVLGLLAAAVLMLAPALASADSASSLTIVGTSDMNDSGLMPSLIQPQFQAAFPQFSFHYLGSATGAAIQNAENGNNGPSMLVVHAPSLENQFVSNGFSYQNQYGHAIFTNDFVLVGPTGDPAGVTPDAHNIAAAMADIARVGAAGGTSTFVSRGGTTAASGTTVEEHALWALMNSAGLTPAGVVVCNVSAADGGGMTPISPTVQATSGQDCPAAAPDSGSVAQVDAPNWYVINSSTQAANMVATNACTFTSPTRPASSCYTLTDRGTMDYLQSKPAGTTGLGNLGILARDNAASSPGGQNALINYFHIYIINPDKPGETVNLTAAQDFMDFITSPAIQSELKGYLTGSSGDNGTTVFNATASPRLTASGFPSKLTAGKTATVTGNLSNLEPGYPALSGQTVSIDELEGLTSVPVATGKTDASGNYSITFSPPSSGSYQASTGSISQIEIASLNPAYGDVLSPATTTAVPLTLSGRVGISKLTASTGGVSVTGRVGPAAPDANGEVDVLARKQGSKGAFKTIGSSALKTGAKTYGVNGNLAPGKWQIETRYRDGNLFTAATSGSRKVTVSGNLVTVRFKKVTIKKGKVIIRGVIGQPSATSGGKLALFAQKSGSTKFKRIGKASIRKGKVKFTIKAKLRKGSYTLQLQYSHRGQTSSFSKLKTVSVR
jgi:tungstate transport system substrate-binding protein